MGRVVAFALSITLHAVHKIVIFAHFIEEFAQILNERCPRYDTQHLHAAAQTQHGNVVVEAIGHREIFRHVASGIGGTVIGNAVPRLRNGKQRRTNVTAAQKYHCLYTSQQLVGIDAMIGVTLDNVGICLKQNAHFIGIFRA